MVQAHTLKPASAGNSEGHLVFREGRLAFTEDGEGRCLTARTSRPGSVLDAEPCTNNTNQAFHIKVRLHHLYFN